MRKEMEKYYNTSQGYLNHLNKKRGKYFDYYMKFLYKFLPLTGKMLEIGCGDGYATKMLSEKYVDANFIGTDISSKFIEYAHKNFENINLKYEVQDSLSFSFDDGYFDAIISTDVVEHITDIPEWLDESIRVLKKGGLLIIVSGNHFSWFEPLKDILTFKTRPPFTHNWFGNFTRLFNNIKVTMQKADNPSFIYRMPDLKNADNGGDYDACYYANQIDLIDYLEDKGMEIINIGAGKFSGLFPYFSGIGIVAKK